MSWIQVFDTGRGPGRSDAFVAIQRGIDVGASKKRSDISVVAARCLLLVMLTAVSMPLMWLAEPKTAAHAAGCVTVVTKAYETRFKPASTSCSDVNVNSVRKIPWHSSSVTVWGEYKNSSGVFVKSTRGSKTYKKNVPEAQWVAIKSLRLGSAYRMRGTHVVEFVLRV